MGYIDLRKVFMVFAILAYVFVCISAVVSLIKIEKDKDDNRELLDTCPDGYDGSQCFQNFNSLFCVAMVDVCLLILAILGILAEAGISFVRRWGNFFTSYIGRGIYIAVVGVLTMGVAGDFGLGTGIATIIVGIATFVMGLFVRTSHPSASA